MTTAIDCTAFDAALMDELYGELDAATSAAMRAHAVTCDACEAQLARMRATRHAVTSLTEAVPAGLEERILAAAAAAMPAGAAALPATASVSASDATVSARDATVSARDATVSARDATVEAPRSAAANDGGGARAPRRGRVLAFIARPELAAAAGVLLLAGLGALALETRPKREALEASSFAKEAPSPAAPPAPAPPPDQAGAGAASPEQHAAASASPLATTPPAAVALAEHDESFAPHGKLAPPAAAKPKAAAGKTRTPTVGGAARVGPAPDDAVADAKALYAAGDCAAALPRLEAVATSDADADLYAARCTAKTRGCAAGAPRYAEAARRHPGTEAAKRALAEAARCEAHGPGNGAASKAAGAPAATATASPTSPATPRAEPTGPSAK